MCSRLAPHICYFWFVSHYPAFICLLSSRFLYRRKRNKSKRRGKENSAGFLMIKLFVCTPLSLCSCACLPACVSEWIILLLVKRTAHAVNVKRARTHTHRLQSLLNSLNYILFESQNALWSLSSIIDWQHVGEAEQNFISLHCYKPGFFFLKQGKNE